jgi:hypothetical protein
MINNDKRQKMQGKIKAPGCVKNKRSSKQKGGPFSGGNAPVNQIEN